jgi:hypothetical protein
MRALSSTITRGSSGDDASTVNIAREHNRGRQRVLRCAPIRPVRVRAALRTGKG